MKHLLLYNILFLFLASWDYVPPCQVGVMAIPARTAFSCRHSLFHGRTEKGASDSGRTSNAGRCKAIVME